jgi:UDP-N-acetylmuramate--alanine ligase
LQALFDDFARCFNDADVVAIADVYTAGEAPIAGIDADALVRGARDHGHKRALKLASPDDLADFLRAECVSGDIFVCLGAGDITAWAGALQGKLEG